MEFIKIGQIVNVHGVKGEVKIYPYTNDADNLLSLKNIFLDEKLTVKYKVKSIRLHKNMLIAKLENINSIEETKTIMNSYIYIVKEKINDEDTHYVEDLIGLDIYEVSETTEFKDAKYFGQLLDVIQPGANDVYEIKHENAKVYLPVIKQVVKKIDIQNKRIYVEIMEGLI